ncbi:hypothetical protein EB796_018810 [Bugula neritina]|uniref:Uncharacterized protein n=1 Tax=Bugula neritina TaxID=10212 RepID=A0A7J7JB34_BUGNE|nr:hypothetical protein EB796_018810 [Bugula neritina]
MTLNYYRLEYSNAPKTINWLLFFVKRHCQFHGMTSSGCRACPMSHQSSSCSILAIYTQPNHRHNYWGGAS